VWIVKNNSECVTIQFIVVVNAQTKILMVNQTECSIDQIEGKSKIVPRKNPHPKLAHKYHRVKLKFGEVWACAHASCPHYMPDYLTPTLLGKTSICWGCGDDLILDESNMKNDQPKCANCDKSTKEIREYLNSLGVE